MKLTVSKDMTNMFSLFWKILIHWR